MTTPDNIIRKTKGYNGVYSCPGPLTRMYTGSRGGVYNGTCVDDDGNPVGDSPYNVNWVPSDPLVTYTNYLYPRWESETEYKDRKSTRLNSSHTDIYRMPSSA